MRQEMYSNIVEHGYRNFALLVAWDTVNFISWQKLSESSLVINPKVELTSEKLMSKSNWFCQFNECLWAGVSEHIIMILHKHQFC